MTDYELLGVTSTATDDELREAFLFLAKKFHPDANPGQEKQAAEHFKNVEGAYFRIRTGAQSEAPLPRPPPSPPPPVQPPRPVVYDEPEAGGSRVWRILRRILATFVVLIILAVVAIFVENQKEQTAREAEQKAYQARLVKVIDPSGNERMVPPEDVEDLQAQGYQTPAQIEERHQLALHPPAWKGWVKFAITSEAYAAHRLYGSPCETCPNDLVVKATLQNTTMTDIEAVSVRVLFSDLFGKPVMDQTFKWDQATIRAGKTVSGAWTLDGMEIPQQFTNAGRTRLHAEVTRVALRSGQVFTDPPGAPVSPPRGYLPPIPP